MGMMAHLALLWSAQALLRGIRVILYPDNNTDENSPIGGYCHNPSIAAMVCVFWVVVGKLATCIWICIVGTKVIPDDMPTRQGAPPFPVLNRGQITRLSPICATQKII